MKVHIIGTHHKYQSGSNCSQADFAEFKQYLSNICSENSIAAIAEEMSRDGLKDVGSTSSSCEAVANAMGLPHIYCDPDRAIRQKLGILQENDVKLEGFRKDWDEAKIQETILCENRKREKIWLIHIECRGDGPVLFICGADHVASFHDLLNRHRFDTEICSIDWSPNNALNSDA